MVLSLRNSFAASLAAHILFLVALSGLFNLLSPRLPQITEITLVSGPGGGGKVGSAEVVKSRVPGGQRGTSTVRTGHAVKGQVSVASPEFVPVGRKPKRSGESLMGAESGEGGGTAGSTMGTGPGAGGAGRKIRYQEPLEYPDWAKEQGIDARVVLRFKVLANGAVDSQVIVRRTSGWRQLDELAMKALRDYLFEPLPPAAPQFPQWGELTFHFKPE